MVSLYDPHDLFLRRKCKCWVAVVSVTSKAWTEEIRWKWWQSVGCNENPNQKYKVQGSRK